MSMSIDAKGVPQESYRYRCQCLWMTDVKLEPRGGDRCQMVMSMDVQYQSVTSLDDGELLIGLDWDYPRVMTAL